MRFAITPPERISDDIAQRAYLSGIDRAAWQVRTELANGELRIYRAENESGNLHIPWPVDGHGLVTLSTASLREWGNVTYHLPLELARGTVGQLLNQLAEWRGFGVTVSEPIHEKIWKAVKCMGQAAVLPRSETHCSDQSAALAEQAIALALDAGQMLANTYAEQMIAAHQRAGQKLVDIMAGDLGTTLFDDPAGERFSQTFNAASIPLCWREIEASEGTYNWDTVDRQIQWCRTNGLKVCVGPLLRWEPADLPDWLYLWEDDPDNLATFIGEYVAAVVTKLRGKVDLWQCAGHLGTEGVLSLSEEDRLRLAARTIELTHTIDPETPAVIAIDQPWGESLGRRESHLPPLYLADTLLRAGLGLRGIVLEINFGYAPIGSLFRGPVEISRLLDSWSVLGLPIYVSTVFPSGTAEDLQSRHGVTLPPGTASLETQRDWVQSVVPLLLAKPFVQGVFWKQLTDAGAHAFAHGGLVDAQGHPKPAFEVMNAIRRDFLG